MCLIEATVSTREDIAIELMKKEICARAADITECIFRITAGKAVDAEPHFLPTQTHMKIALHNAYLRTIIGLTKDLVDSQRMLLIFSLVSGQLQNKVVVCSAEPTTQGGNAIPHRLQQRISKVEKRVPRPIAP